jgi:ATP-dependent DNA ligase
MLAEPGKLDSVESQMNNKEFFIETKYDGERMQAHIDGNKFR